MNRPLIRGLVAAGVAVLLALLLARPEHIFGSLPVFAAALAAVAFVAAALEISVWFHLAIALVLLLFAGALTPLLGFNPAAIGLAVAVGGVVRGLFRSASPSQPASASSPRGRGHF